MDRPTSTRRPSVSRSRRALRPQLDPLEGRLLLNAGDLDLTFGTGGFILEGFTRKGLKTTRGDAFAVAIQGDGKIIAAGNGLGDFGLMRLRTDGRLDTSFGSGGKVTTDFKGYNDEVRDLAIQADGKIVAVGISDQRSRSKDLQNNDFALARYNVDGTLDTTFGPARNGKVTTAISTAATADYTTNLDDDCRAVVIQADGKIIAAGASFNGTDRDFSLVRYNPDGTLDTTFGPNHNGIVTTDFAPGSGDGINDLVVLADGKILVAGFSGVGVSGPNFTLARYNPDGTLDDGTATDTTPGDSFGTAGKVITTIGSVSSSVGDLAIQSDGRIIAGGVASTTDYAVARYHPDGSLDASFGTGGTATVTPPGSSQGRQGGGMVLQADGKIVVAGSTGPYGAVRVILARLDSSGQLDPSFGSAGFSAPSFGTTSEYTRAIALQPDGKVVTAGSAQLADGSSKFAVARFLGDSGAALAAASAPASSTSSTSAILERSTIILTGTSLDHDLTRLAIVSLLTTPKRGRHTLRFTLGLETR